MRRKDKEISDMKQISQVIKKCQVCMEEINDIGKWLINILG